MKILNCTDGTEKPVEFGKKVEVIEPTFDHLWCYKCSKYGDHLPSECKNHCEELEELEAPYISYYCRGCGKRINDERVRVLLNMLGKSEDELNCVECMNKTDYKVKGLYTGASGVSPLKIVKKLGREEHFDNKQEEIYNDFINGGFSDI